MRISWCGKIKGLENSWFSLMRVDDEYLMGLCVTLTCLQRRQLLGRMKLTFYLCAAGRGMLVNDV